MPNGAVGTNQPGFERERLTIRKGAVYGFRYTPPVTWMIQIDGLIQSWRLALWQTVNSEYLWRPEDRLIGGIDTPMPDVRGRLSLIEKTHTFRKIDP